MTGCILLIDYVLLFCVVQVVLHKLSFLYISVEI
jgi:heme/copper-type cytochrome/quinol oxidase subunit 4